jgi:hypothetical protein
VWEGRDGPADAADAVVACTSSSSDASAGQLTEEEARRAWLARLDVPTWGRVAAATATVAQEAAEVAALSDECVRGDDEACGRLAREEEAKRAWLARLDVPSWGAVAAAVSAVASNVAESGEAVVSREEEAKRAWLSRLDMPTWRVETDPLPTRSSVELDVPPQAAEVARERHAQEAAAEAAEAKERAATAAAAEAERQRKETEREALAQLKMKRQAEAEEVLKQRRRERMQEEAAAQASAVEAKEAFVHADDEAATEAAKQTELAVLDEESRRELVREGKEAASAAAKAVRAAATDIFFSATAAAARAAERVTAREADDAAAAEQRRGEGDGWKGRVHSVASVASSWARQKRALHRERCAAEESAAREARKLEWLELFADELRLLGLTLEDVPTLDERSLRQVRTALLCDAR